MDGYFAKFPVIQYDGIPIRDLTRFFTLHQSVKDNAAVFETRFVQDGETPESIAFDFYGDVNLHWLVMAANEIIDPFYDWAMTSEQLSAWVTQKYGAGNENATHHYQLNGFAVEAGTPQANIITNFQYEEALDSERRKIKLIRKTFVTQLLEEAQSILKPDYFVSG